MYGFVYDPFAWYDKQLDEEFEMTELGFDNYDDYLEYKTDQRERAEIDQFDESGTL